MEYPLHILVQGVFLLCRRNQLAGGCMACFGLGLLVATCFESLFFCGCLGALLMGGGILVIVKR
jgi:hypothetical protein